MEKLVKKYRRDLHEIPELDFDLFKTSKYLREVLEKLNFEIYETAKTGLLAFKKGNVNETIAFRSDMDALPIFEENKTNYRSKHDGFMHACGHDAHMSMLLGFANLINEKELLNEGILLIFQPAEETSGGAKVIIDENVLERFNVKKIFGIHVFPNLDEGIYGLTNNVMMAQNGSFSVRFKGISTHGAQPHLGSDAIIAATNYINQIQTIISRQINPIDNAVITVGTINGGSAFNVVSDDVLITGTIRAFSDDLFDLIDKKLKQIAKGIEASFGVKIIVETKKMYPVLKNDTNIYNHVLNVLKDRETKILKPMMTSEDFSYYLEKVPGLFVMLGTKNEDRGFIYPLHNGKFDLDEKVLVKGVELYDLISKSYKLYK